MFYFLYETKNLINSKIYVGIHSTKRLDDGYIGSGVALQRAIKKYGISNFTRTILCFCDTFAELIELESKIVDQNFIDRPDTYNMTLGGLGGGWHHVNSACLNQTENWKNARDINLLACQNGYQKWFSSHDPAEQSSKIRAGRKVGKVPSCFSGKSHSAHSRSQIGEASRVHQRGSGNSQFGTCWIHNPTSLEIRKIPKDELEFFTDSGWCRGRKPPK